MRLFVHQLRAEQLLYWRSREAAFFTFALPIVMFLLFGSLYGTGEIEGVPARTYLLAGMIGYGAISTAFAGLAITLVVRRETGVLKRLRGTPLPPVVYIVGVLASTLLVFLVETLVLIALGRAFFDIGLERLGLPDRLPTTRRRQPRPGATTRRSRRGRRP